MPIPWWLKNGSRCMINYSKTITLLVAFCVWHIGKTGVVDNPKSCKTVAKENTMLGLNKKGTRTTIVPFVNILCICTKPLVIHKILQVMPKWPVGCPNRFTIQISHTEWITKEPFAEYGNSFFNTCTF